MSNLLHLKDNMRASFIQTFQEIKPLPGSPKINRYLALINSLDGNIIVSGSGFSLNKNIAQNSAIGESIERYCASIFNLNEIKYDTYCNLKNMNLNVLNPSIITKYTSEQYKKNLYKEVNGHYPISWVNAKDMISEENIIVPFELIYLCNPPFNAPLRDIISTGLACGRSKEEAIISGLNECIERDAFMHFWLLGLINYEIDFSFIDNIEIKKALKIAENSNLELRAYDITTDLKVPTIITLIRPKKKPGFYLGCASSLDNLTALKKSIEEGLGGFSIYHERINFFEGLIPDTLNSSSTLDEHPIYYLSGKNDSILDELLPKNILKKPFKRYSLSFNETLNTLSSNGHKILYKNLTTLDVKNMNLSVVRVTIPTLAFLSINNPLLDCPRILKKAYQLNKKINLAPHPFP